jgi:hypothetical protein
LYNAPVIKKLCAFLLLLIFAFSITPKKALHDLIADHKDKSFSSSSGILQFNKAGYQCKCDNTVAGSPFTHQGSSVEVSSFKFNNGYNHVIPDGCYSFNQFFFELRGPPLTSAL